MESNNHTLNNLFAQLGLPFNDEAVESFINSHRPLKAGLLLSEASFWSKVQSSFLQEEILKDADWAEVIDQLNVRLHAI